MKAQEGDMRDHLHIRGEHAIVPDEIAINKGSSPHTWRTLEEYFGIEEWCRIISTYVENTTDLSFDWFHE